MHDSTKERPLAFTGEGPLLWAMCYLTNPVAGRPARAGNQALVAPDVVEAIWATAGVVSKLLD